MSGRRLFPIASATCLVVLLAGCGPPPDRNAPSGTTVTQDGIAYSVQYSRELNPYAPDDRQFLGGPARRKGLDRPGMTLVGVFLQAQNNASAAKRAVAPELVTAFGKVFTPMRLPSTDPFAYRAVRLEPGSEFPGSQTIAGESPEEGLVLVYRVPTGVFLADRPYTVQFGSSERAASVQLDI